MHINTPRLKALWCWLAEARYAWFSATGICFSLILILLWPSEQVIRWTGGLLQLGGIGTVIWGISETRALFGYPSFASKTKDWMSRFPLLRRSCVASAGGMAIAIAIGGNVRAYGTHGAGTNLTLESLHEALMKNVTAIHERISQVENDLDKEFRKTAISLENEAQARQAEDTITLKKLEATATGGVHISAIGASWLFVGVILSTAALEIEPLLKWFFVTFHNVFF